jgi:hypothetical protein
LLRFVKNQVHIVIYRRTFPLAAPYDGVPAPFLNGLGRAGLKRIEPVSRSHFEKLDKTEFKDQTILWNTKNAVMTHRSTGKYL